MAIAKTFGIETEFGIIHRGTSESNPITASSMLINAYLSSLAETAEGPTIGWDFQDESPGNDARGSAPMGSLAPEVETHLVNAVLTNGARYYVDHAHPELSTPECADPLSIVRYDRGAEMIAAASMKAADAMLPPGQEIVVYKNNSDGKGNSYGCHENYLMDRLTPFSRIVGHATAHFVSRQIFTGAGKVGSELPGSHPDDVRYQLTQRADFFEEEVGLETTLKRPIVNTRDEPHADPQKYRRLHVIIGDANLAEVATFLKIGTTALILTMVEDDALPRLYRFADPVRALQEVSLDLTLSAPLALDDGTTVTALEIQWDLLGHARNYVESHGTDHTGGPVTLTVLDRWEAILTGLESDPRGLGAQVDWVAKLNLLEAYQQRHDLPWGDARLAALALQYHDLRPERSLAGRLGLERLVGDDDASSAMTEPPSDTRAYFRGRCLERFGDEVVAANWDSIVFDIGHDPLRRVPMMEPLRGTADHVAALFDGCETAADLLTRLEA